MELAHCQPRKAFNMRVTNSRREIITSGKYGKEIQFSRPSEKSPFYEKKISQFPQSIELSTP